jgi:hypothetical protein
MFSCKIYKNRDLRLYWASNICYETEFIAGGHIVTCELVISDIEYKNIMFHSLC